MGAMPTVRRTAIVVSLAAAAGACVALVQDGRRRAAGRPDGDDAPSQPAPPALGGDQEAALDAARARLRARAETLRGELGGPDAG